MERDGGDDVLLGRGVEKLLVGGCIADAHGGRHRWLEIKAQYGLNVEARR